MNSLFGQLLREQVIAELRSLEDKDLETLYEVGVCLFGESNELMKKVSEEIDKLWEE